jgi:hypothetical protein
MSCSAYRFLAVTVHDLALWDRRTVELCPSCHRGVHERIVALMHAKPKSRDRLWTIAQQALDRYTAAGGNLQALRDAGLYGQQ